MRLKRMKANLSHNQLNSAGAMAFANALQQNRSLKSLYLSTNNIGPAGAIALANALKDNSSHKELYLNLNLILTII